jgi:phosphoribosylformimino-5-aminoimidazole carboxamide ribonucleotide (ProFAR) isomerase
MVRSRVSRDLRAVQAIAALGMKVQLGGGLRTRASWNGLWDSA